MGRLVAAGVLPLSCGGDHSLLLPLLKAVRSGQVEPLSMIHVDAHTGTIRISSSLNHSPSCNKRNHFSSFLISNPNSFSMIALAVYTARVAAHRVAHRHVE